MYKKFDLADALNNHNKNGDKFKEDIDSLEARSNSQNTFEPGKAKSGHYMTPKLINESKRSNNTPPKHRSAKSVASRKSFYDDIMDEYKDHTDFLEQKTKEDKLNLLEKTTLKMKGRILHSLLKRQIPNMR